MTSVPNASDALQTFIANLSQKHHVHEKRIQQVIERDLARWSLEELMLVFHQVQEAQRAANVDTLAPSFSYYTGIPIMQRVIMSTCKAFVIGMIFPFQVIGAVYLGLWRWKWKPIWQELPLPTIYLVHAFQNTQIFVKAPERLIRESIEQRKALCVNREGKFKLIGSPDREKYAVLSYVWSEVMAWQNRGRWGAVNLSVRERGLPLEHLERLFDACCEGSTYGDTRLNVFDEIFSRKYAYEWMWLDVVAIPEILENMDTSQREETERLRVGVINNLNSIYRAADQITVIDSLLRRLKSGSLLDCAIMLCFGKWMTRLWTFAECRLGQRILIRTLDHSFDLDKVITWLTQSVQNDQHRYFGILGRLTPLRSNRGGRWRVVFGDAEDHRTARQGGEIHVMKDLLSGTASRYTNIRIDYARSLFPLLEKPWTAGWGIEDGFAYLKSELPESATIIDRYYEYHKNFIYQQDTVVGKCWSNEVADAGRAEGY